MHAIYCIVSTFYAIVEDKISSDAFAPYFGLVFHANPCFIFCGKETVISRFETHWVILGIACIYLHNLFFTISYLTKFDTVCQA